jgi:hypothetical protein
MRQSELQHIRVNIIAAACRKVFRRAGVPWCKMNIVKNNWIRDMVERGTRRVENLRKKLWMSHRETRIRKCLDG